MFKFALNQIRQYFGFSNSESQGFLALIILLLLFSILPFGLDLLSSSKDDSSANDQLKLDSLKSQLLAKINRVKTNDPSFANKDFESNYDHFATEKNNFKVHKLFKFDPNDLDVAGFTSLGLPTFLADRIIKYRNAGGKFKKSEDFQKIYGLRPETYARLAPFISLRNEAKPLNEYAKNELNLPNPSANSIEKIKYESKYSKHPTAFDLNKADTATLMNLKGIGSKLSLRIIKYRDELGGFNSENQIKEVYGLDSTVVLEILKYGSIKTGVYSKIDINNTLEIRHRYLKPYLAKAIIAYRVQHGKFESVNDLKNIKILDETTIEKIKPYLKF